MTPDTTPTPRTDAAVKRCGDILCYAGAEPLIAEAKTLERELAAAKVENERLMSKVGEMGIDAAYCDAAVSRARELEAENAELRKDRERLKWLFSGYAVARWSHEYEVGAVDRDTLMYSMFDLDDDMKAAMEGGER